ncbi:MAG TPA: hypothetical protein PLH77_03000, partial [Bacilli bacterium]|nr:hypothetical protein [Bacilli bacterium]
MKRNKEVIDITLSGQPKMKKAQANLGDFYHEMKEIKKDKDPYLEYSLDQKNEKITKFINEFDNTSEPFFKRLYTIILFQEGIKKDLKFKINIE